MNVPGPADPPSLAAASPEIWQERIAGQAMASSRRGCAVKTFLALLHRDLLVGRRQVGIFLIRTLIQPAFLVFVLGYLMPRMQLVHPSMQFLLIPGMVGLSMFFAGMQAVTFPLIDDFGYSGELDDRLMAPIGVRYVAIEKILVGAVHALLAGTMVLPLSALLIPFQHILPWNEILPLMLDGLAVALLSSSFGLFLGVLIPPRKLGVTTAAVVAPLLFLGCTYYPWKALAAFPVLQRLVLLNPLVYACEGLRGVLTPTLPHMNLVWSVTGTLVSLALLATIGVHRFERKLTE